METLENRTLMTAGALDPTFGVGGIVITPFPDAFVAVASDVEVQSDGRIIAVGTTSDGGPENTVVLARYLPNGQLDASFGNGGLVVTDIRGAIPMAALQADGKILVGATTFDDSNTVGPNFTVARFLQNGQFDPSFGIGGTVVTDFGGNDYFGNITVQASGRIVAVGYSDEDVAVATYLPNGQLDPSFGNGGTVVTDLGGSEWGRGVAIRPNGMIVVGAQYSDFSTHKDSFAIVQYTANGNLDMSFGVGGSVITHFGSAVLDNVLTGIVLQPDGKIVAAGGMADFGEFVSDFLVVRYTRDGAVDTSFGTGGYTTTSFGDGFDMPSAIVLQPNGQIVVAGPYQGDTAGFSLARFNRDGSLDTNFGIDGKVTTSVGLFSFNFGLALQPDGKIVTAGFTFNEDTFTLDFAVVRYEGHDAPKSRDKANPSTLNVRGNSPHAEDDYTGLDLLFDLTTLRKRPGQIL